VDVKGTWDNISLLQPLRESGLQLMATDESTISSMADIIRRDYPDTPLRLALTVPGILHIEKSPSQIDAASALESFQVNALGPLLLMKHLSQFLPAKSAPEFQRTSKTEADGESQLELPSHAVYAMMAARVGSVSDNSSGGWYSYRASKASVFQLAKTFDLYLRSKSGKRALAVALHPGTVRTDFTQDFWKGREMLDPLDSAERLLEFIIGMSPDVEGGRGKCWDWKGEEVYP
jgi:NAD(P)-dependent dehydrogenase (short-subunit alcohol dehydrogenase family)